MQTMQTQRMRNSPIRRLGHQMLAGSHGQVHVDKQHSSINCIAGSILRGSFYLNSFYSSDCFSCHLDDAACPRKVPIIEAAQESRNRIED